MPKKYPTIRHLSAIANGLEADVEKARSLYRETKQKIADLDTPHAKRRFTQLHINEQKTALRKEGAAALRAVLHAITSKTSPALKERPLWTKQRMLSEARFVQPPKELPTSSEDRLLKAIANLNDSINRLQHTALVQRMGDDALLSAAKDYADAGDYASLSCVLAESTVRDSALLHLQMKKIVNGLDLPESDGASDCFAVMVKAEEEVKAFELALEDPTDVIASSTVKFHDWKRKKEEEQQAKGKEDKPVEERLPDDYTPPESAAGTVVQPDSLPPAA